MLKNRRCLADLRLDILYIVVFKPIVWLLNLFKRERDNNGLMMWPELD